MENNNHTAYEVTSRFLKTLLILEYGDSIRFHVRNNELGKASDKLNCILYVKAAIFLA